MRFTIPGDNTVRPGKPRPVRCDDFIVEFPTPADTAHLDSLIGGSDGTAWERVKSRGAASVIVWGYGPEILASGKASDKTFSQGARIDLDAEPEILDAVIAAVPGAFAARVQTARDAYEEAVARIAADQSGANEFIAALTDQED